MDKRASYTKNNTVTRKYFFPEFLRSVTRRKKKKKGTQYFIVHNRKSMSGCLG